MWRRLKKEVAQGSVEDQREEEMWRGRGRAKSLSIN